MPQRDWSKFSLKIYINTSMQHVYNAWTTRTNLEKWFLRKAEFTKKDSSIRDNNGTVEVGDKYSWLWHGHPDTTTENGTVTEANGKDRFQFVFGNAGIVTVQLKEAGEMTELLLTQHDIPVDEDSKMNYHVGCSTGWTFYLANIKSVLEYGHDLRNKSLMHTNVINS